ncbi:MAG: hypothetical protein IKS17_07480 [Firmicutes bacterium]|nr:hypothetical protein [Bacillota bacterium]
MGHGQKLKNIGRILGDTGTLVSPFFYAAAYVFCRASRRKSLLTASAYGGKIQVIRVIKTTQEDLT